MTLLNYGGDGLKACVALSCSVSQRSPIVNSIYSEALFDGG